MRTLIFFLCISLPSLVFAAPQYRAEIGKCSPAKTKREAKRAEHLFFSIDEGKKLWKELGTLRLDSQKLKLINTNLKLQSDIIKWWKIQMNAADKTVESQKKHIKDLVIEKGQLKSQVSSLQKDVQKWHLDAVKYQGQRYQFLIWGVVGGVVVTGAVVAVVSILAFGGSK